MKLTRQALGLIYESCNGRCYYCGIELPPFGTWEPDHMKPRSQGGADAFFNIVAACRQCNRSKGGRNVEEYRQDLLSRAFSHVNNAHRILGRFLAEPNTDHEKALAALDAAMDAIGKTDLVFFGEAAPIPRKDDPMFTEEFEQAMSDPSLDEGDDLSVN